MKAHHHGHEHELEPQHGLPERLPAGERLLWQASPSRRRVALDVFHMRAVALYFALILVLRFALQLDDSGSIAQALAATSWAALLFALALGLLWLLADLTARTTVYTITDRRVVMRIGIVLSLTFNLPLVRLAAAQVKRRGDGSGDLVLQLATEDKIAWLHLWPHVRAWRLSHPQPMLRALAAVDEPARVLTSAWTQAQPDGSTATAMAESASGADRSATLGHAQVA